MNALAQMSYYLFSPQPHREEGTIRGEVIPAESLPLPRVDMPD